MLTASGALDVDNCSSFVEGVKHFPSISDQLMTITPHVTCLVMAQTHKCEWRRECHETREESDRIAFSLEFRNHDVLFKFFFLKQV